MKHDSDHGSSWEPGQIASWVSRYRGSGLGLRQFAERHGLPATRLHYWVYQKNRTPAAAAPAPVAGFQEVNLVGGLPGQNWAVEVSLPAGPVARFSATVAPAWIGAVMEVLRRPC
jgi:hypothetical protein